MMRALLPLLLSAATAAYAASGSGSTDITVPKAPWRMQFDMAGARLKTRWTSPGDDAAAFLYTRGDGISIDVRIARATKCNSGESCRDMLYQSLAPRWDASNQVVQSQIGAAWTIEAFVPKQRNLPVREQTLYAEYHADGWWVDLRVIKGGYQPADRARFVALVESVRFEAKP